jgi:hypothetical protein
METANLSAEAASVENSQCAFSWQRAQERWHEGLKRLDARIREKPRQYFLGALAAGYVLQVIPWRALLFVLGVLCLRLLRPVLLLVAVIKLTELIERKSSPQKSPAGNGDELIAG